MSDEKDIIPVETIDHMPTEYGDRQAVATFGQRIKAMLPGGDKMNDAQAMALAQYSMLLDANPFRGEVYGYSDSHGFHLVDGYKMLVRWARKQCPYTETYKPIEGLPAGAIGYRCYILREDARPTLREFVGLGASFDRAYELATVSAVGVVTKSDMTTNKGYPQDPPKGWTWDDVAKKRALKNALNLSHGAPSPREIAAQSWEVNGIETTPADWTGITPEMTTPEREAIAAGNAVVRQVDERIASGQADANRACADLLDEPVRQTTASNYSGRTTDEPLDVDTIDEITVEPIEPPAPRVGKDPAELIANANKAEDAPTDSPHWSNDEKSRKRYFDWLNKHNWTADNAKEALGVEHIADYDGSLGDVFTALLNINRG